MMVQFQAVAWEGYDDEQGNYIVRAYGRTEDGKSVSASTVFEPYFFVKMKAAVPEVRGAKIEYLSAKDLWGFQNGARSRFAKLTFRTHKEFRGAMYNLQREKWHIYEANLDPVLRFMHVSGCTSTGWITVSDGVDDPDARCDLNLRGILTPVKDKDSIAPIKVMSFDIECYSSTGDFPNPTIPGDCIFQIGMTTARFGQEISERKCLCLKQTTGQDCESFETEKDLIEAFGRYLAKVDPDIITGWNIFGFDLEFLFKRASRLGVETLWGRRTDLPSELTIKHLASSALGSNELKMVPMVGRYVFDLFQDIKREHKLESYSLNAVSKHFLKDSQKIDMPVKEIFERFRQGDPARLGEVAQYCIQDTVLPHKIMAKVCQIQNQIEMAKACWVPLSFLSERGQQIKVFSQMAYKARQLGFLIPTIRRPDGVVDGYEGATVLEAQTGAYYSPITALDFASLYPSIMVAHNLCYSTLVMDKRYANVPGVAYEKYGEHVFAQTDADGKPIVSLLPSILTDLKAFRKKAKKLMAQAEGTPMEAVYNGQQLAYKISMNSIYGFTGAAKGMLPCVAIASTVTMRGRQMIEETKNYVEENFPGAKVRYGDTDSVMVEFDVEGRKGQEAIDYSWEQGLLAAEQCTKLFKAPNDLELEKVYCPYFLYSKKRYAAKMWEGKTRPDGSTVVAFKKIDIKGLQVVRRDSCPFVRETLKKLLDMMLESSDPRPVIAFARQASEEISSGKVPVEKLLMSKQLGSDYKVPMPHVAVRDKIRSRAPGSEPRQGDRVQYVVTKGPGKLYEKAEDPEWAREKNVPLDYQYYFLNQLKKPICDLLEPLVGACPERLIFGAATAGDKKGAYDPRMKSIDSYFKRAP